MPESAGNIQHRKLLTNSLRALTQCVAQAPGRTLAIVAVISIAAVVFTMTSMRFKTERSDLIDPDAPFHRRWLSYIESFGDASDIVVVVEADRPDTIKSVIDTIGKRLEAEPERFKNVLYRIEPGTLREKGLQYLSPQQLDAGLKRLDEYRPIVQGQWDKIQVASLGKLLALQIHAKSAPEMSHELAPLLTHAELLSTSLNRYLADSGDFVNPWPDLVFVDPRVRSEANDVIYLMNDAGTMGFLKAFPVGGGDGFEGDSLAIDRIRKIVADVRRETPAARIGITGIPVLENDEMRRSQDDMLLASLISFALVGMLLVIGFRGVRHPLLAMVMLAVGMAWTFGYTTAAVGHLNILSVSFAAILIGLGIDFAIHFLSRYLEQRHHGDDLIPALLNTSSSVGIGILTAGITTAFAFFCATMTQFLGIAELGIIAGGGILLCAAATFVVLPALIAWADRDRPHETLPTPFEERELRNITRHYPTIIFAVSFGMAAWIGSHAFEVNDGKLDWKIEYDSNLLNLQADDIESVNVQRRVFQQAQDSLLYAVSIANTPEHVRQLRKKFEQLPSVHHVEELASRLPAYPPAETKLLVQAFDAQLARIPRQVPQFPVVDPLAAGQALEQLLAELKTNTRASAAEAHRQLDQFLERLAKRPTEAQVAFFAEFQMRLAAELMAQFDAIAKAANPEPVTFADLPSALTSRFVSQEGKWLLQVFPKEQIWDPKPLAEFVAEIRTVDPHATGTPLQNYEASQQIMVSYKNAAIYALAVICLVLLVDFLGHVYKWRVLLVSFVLIGGAATLLHSRGVVIDIAPLMGVYLLVVATIAAIVDFCNLRDAVLALLPPLLGGLLMFGVLSIAGISLNPANLIVLPLVLGIGVDDGVHVVHDFRQQSGHQTYRTSSSTMNSIILTSLTSMIGFGSMMIASHRGLSSVGLVLVIGVGACLFVSLVPLPAILTLISRTSRHQHGPLDEISLMSPAEELSTALHQTSATGSNGL
ncbi:MAG: MMPL family transporter [Planctomycetota bacterium]|nr:MMPL family transporter [Planctomycetota bacterium]